MMIRYAIATASVLLLVACAAIGVSQTPQTGMSLQETAAVGHAPAETPKNGIYVAGAYFLNGYGGNNEQNEPPTCVLYLYHGEYVVDVGVDRKGDLIVPSNSLGDVHILAGPRLCGQQAWSAIDVGSPVDAAAVDAIGGLVVVASENGEFNSSNNKFYGQVEVCRRGGSFCGNLSEVSPGLFTSLAVAMNEKGDCWSAGVDYASNNALYYFKGCGSPGVPAKRWLNGEWGGLDVDRRGNLLSIDQSTASLYVYRGCDPTCRKVGGPFPLHGNAMYGHLNRRGTLFAAAAGYNSIDVYTYEPHALTYDYSFTNGVGGATGVAFSPGR